MRAEKSKAHWWWLATVQLHYGEPRWLASAGPDYIVCAVDGERYLHHILGKDWDVQ